MLSRCAAKTRERTTRGTRTLFFLFTRFLFVFSSIFSFVCFPLCLAFPALSTSRYENSPQSSIYDAARVRSRIAPAARAARLIALGEFALRAPSSVAEEDGGRVAEPNLRLNPLRLATMSGADAALRAPLYPLVGGRSAAVQDSRLRRENDDDDTLDIGAVCSPIMRSALASHDASGAGVADDAADDAAQPAIIMGWREQTRVSCNFRGEGRWFFARVVAVHFVQSR